MITVQPDIKRVLNVNMKMEGDEGLWTKLM